MPRGEGSAAILKELAERGGGGGGGGDDADVAELLEAYLTEVGLKRLDEGGAFPDFPEAAVVIQHSGIIYAKSVDRLWLRVQNAVLRDAPADGAEPSEDASSPEKAPKRARGKAAAAPPADFRPIRLEEASNIDSRPNTNQPPPKLPRTFMAFEPRVASENDVVLHDYAGEPIGLFSDFRVNWNADGSHMLCEDMDFGSGPSTSGPNHLHGVRARTAAAIVSPSDSGHNSDGFADFAPPSSPEGPSDRSVAAMTPVPESPVNTAIPESPVNTAIPESPINIAIPESPVVEFQTPAPKTPRASKPRLLSTDDSFDMRSSFAGTAKPLKPTASEFKLPARMIRKIIERRKKEVRSLGKFVETAMSDASSGEKVDAKDVSVSFKRKSIVSWSRLKARKKLRLAEFDFDSSEGFSEKDDPPEDKTDTLCDVKGIIDNLEEDIDRLSISSNRNGAEDDDVADNCYLGSQNIFEPSIARRLAEADLQPSCTFTQQSDISKRVEAWHASIQEKLKRSESRTFDIKEYSNDILSMLSAKNTSSTVKFSEILENKSQEEVARYFLTALMLANKSNVRLEQPEPLACGDFEMRLLSSHLEEIDEDFFG